MTFDRKLSQAAELARAGRFEETELACRQLLQTKPKSFDALQLLGIAQAQLGRPTEAVVTLNQAIDKDRTHAGVRNDLGQALLSLGQYQEAQRCFRQAIDLAPMDAAAYIGLGVTLLRLDEVSEAIETLEKALRRSPDAPPAMDAMGECLMRQGELTPAMKHHLSALESDPTLASGYVNLFNVLMLMHVTDDARRVADLGVADLPAELPEVAELRMGLAHLAWLEGRLEDARAQLEATASIERRHDGYRNIQALRADHRRLKWLVDFRFECRGPLYDGPTGRAFFVVGDAHTLPPSETVVVHGEQPHRVLSLYIAGGSIEQIAAPEDNPTRSSVRASIRAIPQGHPVLFMFGEADCRLPGPLIQAHRRGRPLDQTARALVERYVDFVVSAAAARGHTVVVCGVPAPTAAALAGRAADDRQGVIDAVRAVNNALRQVCAEREVRLVDVYARTATPEGTAADGYHFADLHLHPRVIAEIMSLS